MNSARKWLSPWLAILLLVTSTAPWWHRHAQIGSCQHGPGCGEETQAGHLSHECPAADADVGHDVLAAVNGRNASHGCHSHDDEGEARGIKPSKSGSGADDRLPPLAPVSPEGHHDDCSVCRLVAQSWVVPTLFTVGSAPTFCIDREQAPEPAFIPVARRLVRQRGPPLA